MAMQLQQQQQQQQQLPQPQLQQNSTFIDDHLEPCSMLLNFPDSPILPTKNRNHHRQNQVERANSQMPSANLLSDPKVTAPIAINDAPPPAQPSAKQNKHGSTSHANDQHMANSRRHRHRLVSLCGANSTLEEFHKELPIWLNNQELRYVSGVTNATTCNEIIKALIDDELCNGNRQLFMKDSNLKHKIDGVYSPEAALRDYNDFVITERWRGIERSYDGNMAILPVWRAWSRVHNELRLSLKLRQELQEPLPQQQTAFTPTNFKGFSLFKWLKGLLRFGGKKKDKIQSKSNKASVKMDDNKNYLQSQSKQEIIEEVVLVLLPDQHYENATIAQNIDTQARSNKSIEKYRKSGRRKKRTACEPAANNNYNNYNNCIRRRRKDAPLRSSLRNKLASLHAEMNYRYEKEYNLTRQLTQKCQQYKIQNERYNNKEMDLSVGQLQRNIEAHAEDIIKTERELLELKQEIKHDISLINNLKRMTLEKDTKVPQEMQFVDNIYEFCDNNASIGMRRKMSSNEEAEALARFANPDTNNFEFKSLVLWRQPLKTIKYGCLELVDLLAGLGSRFLSRRLLFIFVIVATLFAMPGPHSSYMQVCRTNLGFFLHWLGLGFVSLLGFGTGLHTFLLYLGPHIAGVTLAAYECQTLEFPVPPYPARKICPKEPYVRYLPSTWQILSKVRPEAISWSLGTVLGELPPYFMARAARLSGNWSNDSGAEASDPDPPCVTHKTFFNRSKELLKRVVLRIGFFGILLCSSVPNPFLDLAGVACGHFLVPFWKFLMATLIGKAVIKSTIQQIIVIIAFTEDQVKVLLQALGAVPFVGAQVQLSLKELLDSTKRHMHHNGTFDGFRLTSLASTFSGFRLAAHLFRLISFIILAYFLTSLLHNLAQRRYKRNQLSQVRPAHTCTKIDEIFEKNP